MADASDSKSDAGNSVWVQVPSPAGKANGVDKSLLHFALEAERSLNPGFKVSAPLRSAQSRRPPDVLRPISCEEKKREF